MAARIQTELEPGRNTSGRAETGQAETDRAETHRPDSSSLSGSPAGTSPAGRLEPCPSGRLDPDQRDPGERDPDRFRARAFLALAAPMIVSRAGLAVMAIADGIMVSRYRPVELAWLSLADGTLGRLLDICIAFLIGGLVLASRHLAQGAPHRAHSVWRRTLPAALGLGLTGAALGLLGRPLLAAIGQSPALAAGAGPVMAILGAGFPAALVAIASAVYLEASGRPRAVAAWVVAANLLNLGGNWLLIAGHLGAPALGARGSALSTTLMRWVLAMGLGALAWRQSRPPAGSAQPGDAGLAGPVPTPNRFPEGLADHAAEQTAADPDFRRSQWQLGLGAAAGTAAMIVLGSSLILFAGRLGVLPLAAFSAAWALGAPALLVILGLSDATAICVAAADGRAGLQAAGRLAWRCLGLATAITGLLGLALTLAAPFWAGLYAPTPAAGAALTGPTLAHHGAALARSALLRASIASALPIVALILVADAVGFLLAAALRALADAAWPAAIELTAMLLLVPVAAELALGRSWGVTGLFLAMLTAALTRAALLAARFLWRTRSGGQDRTRPADEPKECL